MMRIWSMRRALIVLAGVSAVVAVGLAVFGIEAATAALAVSWLCGLAWMVLSAHATSTKLSKVLEHQRANRRGLRQMQTRLSDQSKLERQTASQLSRVRKDPFRVLVQVQRTPRVTHELRRCTTGWLTMTWISAAGRPSRAGRDGCPRRHWTAGRARPSPAWKQESFDGRRLREMRRLDRATAFVIEDLEQTRRGEQAAPSRAHRDQG
jgi:hypothetical protein